MPLIEPAAAHRDHHGVDPRQLSRQIRADRTLARDHGGVVIGESKPGRATPRASRFVLGLDRIPGDRADSAPQARMALSLVGLADSGTNTVPGTRSVSIANATAAP